MDQDRNVGYTSAMSSVVPNPSLFVSLCVLHVSVAETAYASDTRHLNYVSILWLDWQPHLDKHSVLRIHQNLGVKRDKRQCGSIQQFVTHPICVADTMQCPGVKLLSMQLHLDLRFNSAVQPGIWLGVHGCKSSMTKFAYTHYPCFGGSCCWLLK